MNIFSRHKCNLNRLPLVAVIALTCSLPLNCAIAQDSGLRGAVKDTAAETLSKLKKKKPKSKLETSILVPDVVPLPRYEPTNLDPNADPNEANVSQNASDGNANSPAPQPNIAVPTKKPELTSAQDPTLGADAASPTVDTMQTGGFPREDVTTTGSVTPLEGEVPDPASRIISDGASERETSGRAIKDNSRVGSIEGNGKLQDKETYDAPGITAGEFTLRPTLKQGLTWTSNADSSANGKSAVLSETEMKLRAESNWSRHRLNLEAVGSFRKTLSGEAVSDPTLGLSADFGIDVSTAVQVTGLASWNHGKESASAPTGFASPFTRPTLDTLRASLGVAYDPGLIGLTTTGQVARQMYGSAVDSLGVSVPQSDRNNTFASVTLRGSYDLSPALTPFLEAELGRRIYDHTVDASGLRRSATRYGLRAGVTANLGEKLSGEFAAGWLMENIDDTSLKNVSGLDLKGTLNWSPQRGTNVAFALGTTVEGATSATSSGSVLYTSSATLTRTIRPNLEANFALGLGWRDYASTSPSETILSAEAGGTYFLNRYVGINGRLRHERILTPDATRKQSTSSIYLGVTLRR